MSHRWDAHCQRFDKLISLFGRDNIYAELQRTIAIRKLQSSRGRAGAIHAVRSGRPTRPMTPQERELPMC